MSDFTYINRTYGLNIRRGTRVRYTGGDKPRLGTVTEADGAHIDIRFDGAVGDAGPFHPTWKLEYEPREVAAR